MGTGPTEFMFQHHKDLVTSRLQEAPGTQVEGRWREWSFGVWDTFQGRGLQKLAHTYL